MYNIYTKISCTYSHQRPKETLKTLKPPTWVDLILPNIQFTLPASKSSGETCIASPRLLTEILHLKVTFIPIHVLITIFVRFISASDHHATGLKRCLYANGRMRL